MPKQFDIQKATACGNPYLKVKLLDNSLLQTIKELIESSSAVHHCNITHNKRDDLIVYINSFYTIDEVCDELQKLLKGHFQGGVLEIETKSLTDSMKREISPYQDALNLYITAINDLQARQNYRHAMDDLRLSVELLLRNVLSNKKSLENQQSDLKEYLGRKGKSTETIALVTNDMQAIIRYFNVHVKHNDDIVTNEIDSIVYAMSNLIHILLS